MIPGNDDAIRAVKLLVGKMADAVIEANQGAAEEPEEAVEMTDADYNVEYSEEPAQETAENQEVE